MLGLPQSDRRWIFLYEAEAFLLRDGSFDQQLMGAIAYAYYDGDLGDIILSTCILRRARVVQESVNMSA